MNKRKILFLDFDGVLNSHLSLGVYHEHLSGELVRRVNKIVKATNCDVVISSSWRCGNTPIELAHQLFNLGFTMAHKIVDETPRTNSFRGEEIKDYLDTQKNYVYCILDDETDMREEQKPFFVKTDPEIGITENDVRKCIEILGKDNEVNLCKKCDGYGYIQNDIRDESCTCKMGRL